MSDLNLWINGAGNVAHPDAPRGGGGLGNFKSALPLGYNLDPNLATLPHPFSPSGQNSAPDGEQAQEILDADTPTQLDGGTPNPTSPDEVPVFTTTTGVPNDIRADTVDDFVSGSNAAMGDGDAIGHMKPSIRFNSEFDDKGRISRVNMVVDTQIVRPRLGLSRASGTERDLIKKAEALIKAHEERHRDIAKDFTTRACRAMRGKSADNAQAVFAKFMKDMDKAQADFDSREGMLFVDHNGPNGKAGPATDVRTGPIKK